jgi:predicted pyridoxine 5'-phosphate oxidase superfamily flavin-nucleotide-binding protein
VRGLIHTDRSRHINRIKHPKRTYEYVRYEFSNRSEDIKRIFCEACDALGVQWRVMNRESISVARRASVARLDEFIGPERQQAISPVRRCRRRPYAVDMLDHAIGALDDLREHIGEPSQRVLDKQLDHLDRHCRDFIARSPIALLATADAEGRCDCSPRGGPPGFARVLDARRLAIPDYTGNRRQDSHVNLLENPYVGLLFLLPGMGETLRVNGRGTLTRDPELLEACPRAGRSRRGWRSTSRCGRPTCTAPRPSCAAASGTRPRGRRPTSCRRRPRSTATTATRPA